MADKNDVRIVTKKLFIEMSVNGTAQLLTSKNRIRKKDRALNEGDK